MTRVLAVVALAVVVIVGKFVLHADSSILIYVGIAVAAQGFDAWQRRHRGGFQVSSSGIGPLGRRVRLDRGNVARFTAGADGCPTLAINTEDGVAVTTVPLFTYDGGLRADRDSYALLSTTLRANPVNAPVADQLDALADDWPDRLQFARQLREQTSAATSATTSSVAHHSGSPARWTQGAWGLLLLLVVFAIAASDGETRWLILMAAATVGVVVTWFVGRTVSTEGTRLTMHWQRFDTDGGIRAELDERGDDVDLRLKGGMHRAKRAVRRDGRVIDRATWQAVATALAVDPANAAVAERLRMVATQPPA